MKLKRIKVRKTDKALRDTDIEQEQFEGGFPLGYKKGNIKIHIFEDEDRLDVFYATVAGEDKGRVRTVGDFYNLLNETTGTIGNNPNEDGTEVQDTPKGV